MVGNVTAAARIEPTPSATYYVETVKWVRHWTPTLFSFGTSRDPGLRFTSGQFVMVGLVTEEGRNLVRAYSIASPAWHDELEFYSIKVPDGPLTSRLQHIQPGDKVLISRKPTGTLVVNDLNPGKRLFLLATGTGLAPFLSLVRDLETYERFETVVLVHGVRNVDDLAYRDFLTQDLPRHEFLGEFTSEKLLYYPTATREPFVNNGRLTELIENGKLCEDLGIPAMDPASDRAMLCGSPSMLKDTAALLDRMGFQVSPHTGVPGDYVIERAFVER
jgi:ferredoxin/flavodoxin---NADP+ reductase